MTAKTLLRTLLLAGVGYFCAMAAAHFFGLKWPVLFVYYDTPFHAYQDKIISFAVQAYAGLFWQAAREPSAVPVALGVLALTVAGLSHVTLSGALAQVLQPGQPTWPYWAQIAMIAGYLAALVAAWRSVSRAASR